MESVLQCVRKNQGISIIELSKKLGFSHSTATYYLKKLRKDGFVERRDDGRMARYFPTTPDRKIDLRMKVILANPRRRAVIKFLDDPASHDLTVNQMAKKLGVPYNSFMHVLRALQDAKMVDLERNPSVVG